jgi:hypothetical protein
LTFLLNLSMSILFIIKLGDNINIFTRTFLSICKNCIREIQFEKRTSNYIKHEEIKDSKLNIHVHVPNLFDDHAYDKPIGQVWHALYFLMVIPY